MASTTSKYVPLVTFLLLLAAAAMTAATARTLQEQPDQHEMWMKKYARVYKDDLEKAARLRIFKVNADYIDWANRAGHLTYTLAVNQFADLTTEEFKSTFLGYHHQPPRTTTPPTVTALSQSAPYSVNWVTQGAVTPVKDQGTCGCCWAFAVVAATEGAVQIATGQLMSLSEQQVLDCTSSEDSCNGGNLYRAFQYVEYTGLVSESSYPYDQVQGTCSVGSSSDMIVAHISGIQGVMQGSIEALQEAVALQPVAVGIQANERGFQFYQGGIYSGDAMCGEDLDHAVTVVGYGTDEDGNDYWLLKNQWGDMWGEGGYMRMARTDVQGADCGLTATPLYPVV